MTRVERHVRCTHLEDAEHADDHVEGAFDRESDDASAYRAGCAETPRHDAAALLELAVRDRHALAGDGCTVRCQGSACRNHLVDARVTRPAARCGVPRDQLFSAFVVAEDGEGADGRVRLCDRRLEQRDQVSRHAAYGFAVEEIGVVDEAALHAAVGALVELHREVELGFVDPLGALLLERQHVPRGVRRRTDRLHRQHHVEQRARAPLTLRVQLANQALERNQIGYAVQQLISRAADEVTERRSIPEVQAHHHGCDAVPQHGLEARLVAQVGDGSEHDVALPGIAVQQRREPCRDALEQRGVALPAQGAQPGGDVTRDGEWLHRARKGDPLRAGTVGGHLQARCAGEAVSPELDPFRELRTFHPLALPAGVLEVLGGRSGDRRRLRSAERRVEGDELGDDRVQRRAVEHDVVHRQVQPVLIGRDPSQTRPDQGTAVQQVGTACLVGHDAAGLAHGVVPLHGAHVVQRELERGLRADHLRRLAVADHEGRSPDLVAPEHLVEGGPECVDVEWPALDQHDRLVVGARAGRNLAEVPELFLRCRQRRDPVHCAETLGRLHAGGAGRLVTHGHGHPPR